MAEKDSVPHQSVITDNGLSVAAQGCSICELAEQLGTRQVRLAEQWREFVRTVCFLPKLEEVQKESLLIADKFAAGLEEKKLEEYRRQLEQTGSQLVLLSNKAAVLDMKDIAIEEYFVLSHQGLYPITDLTQKSLHQKHNLRKLWRTGAFLTLP